MKKLTKQPHRYPCLLFTEHVVYLAQVNKEGNRFLLFRETALPDGMLVNGDIVNVPQFGAFLTQLVKQSVLKETHVIIGLPELKATTQSLRIPSMTADETRQAIESQAASFLPFPLEDAYLDWQYIHQPKDDEATILVSAMPKAVIDKHIAALLIAGLLPVAFETTALSLARLVPENAPDPNIALEHSGSTAVVIINKDKTIEVSSVLQDGTALADKLQRLINYYLKNQEEGEEVTISTIYLAGKDITREFITQVQQLKMQPVLLSANISNIAKERQTELAVLASLSRKDAEPPDDTKTVNLLPEESADVLKTEQRTHLEVVGKGLAMGLLTVFVALSIFTLITLKNKTTALGEEVSELTAKQGQSVVFNPDKVALVDTTSTENKRLISLIKMVFDTKPEGVMLTGISFDRETDELLISGRAGERGKLIVYRDALEALDEISGVTIPLSSLEQELDAEFRMQISL